MKATIRSAIVCFISLSTPLRADVGVFTGTGQNLRQISTQDVQLESINVTITPGRGPFLFDGTVPGMDQVDYKCQFVLRSLTDKACVINVGFPIDSQFAAPSEGKKHGSDEWVSEYSFIARDQKETYHVNIQWQGFYVKTTAIFTWAMNFQGHETRTLMVQYRIPMSMTLATTSKRELFPETPSTNEPWIEQLNNCVLEFAGYTTETGSSWAGNVKEATFTIVTEPFERYLNQRLVFDCLPSETRDDDDAASMKSFALRHEWWYRDIKPAGWRPSKDGVQWVYKDFKPKDLIKISYYLTLFPRLPEDVNSWIDELFKVVPELHSNPEKLSIVRQVLLATYGQTPSDPIAKTLVEDQIWYHPVKDFSLSKLDNKQRAILRELDRRVELITKEARR